MVEKLDNIKAGVTVTLKFQNTWHSSEYTISGLVTKVGIRVEENDIKDARLALCGNVNCPCRGGEIGAVPAIPYIRVDNYYFFPLESNEKWFTNRYSNLGDLG
jgi:hypothetical protein